MVTRIRSRSNWFTKWVQGCESRKGFSRFPVAISPGASLPSAWPSGRPDSNPFAGVVTGSKFGESKMSDSPEEPWWLPLGKFGCQLVTALAIIVGGVWTVIQYRDQSDKELAQKKEQAEKELAQKEEQAKK